MDNEPKDSSDATAETASSPNAGGQVMDVTAPDQKIEVSDASAEQDPSSVDATPDAVVDAPADSSDQPETTPSNPESAPLVPESESAPAEPEVSEAAPTNIDITSADTSEPAPEGEGSSSEPTSDSAPAEPQLLHATPPAHKSHGPVLVIVIAIIVALGLAGLVVYTYLKDKNGDIKRDDSTATNQTVDKPQASAADVDAAEKEIDSGLQKADDNKDFPSTELTDTTLGL